MQNFGPDDHYDSVLQLWHLWLFLLFQSVISPGLPYFRLNFCFKYSSKSSVHHVDLLLSTECFPILKGLFWKNSNKFLKKKFICYSKRIHLDCVLWPTEYQLVHTFNFPCLDLELGQMFSVLKSVFIFQGICVICWSISLPVTLIELISTVSYVPGTFYLFIRGLIFPFASALR